MTIADRQRRCVARPRIRPLIGPRTVGALVGTTAVIALAFLLTQGYSLLVGPIPDLERALDFDLEANLPTGWNGMLLGAVAAVIGLAAALAPAGACPSRRSLAVAATVVAYLALDEISQLHELASIPADAVLRRFEIDWMTWAWLLFGVVAASILAGIAVRWGRSLPNGVRQRAAAALLVYLSGALVVEAFNGWLYPRQHDTTLNRSVYTGGVLLEELLEMAACIIALTAFARLIVIEDRDGAPTVRSTLSS